MNSKERVKLFFKTISEIAGFEITPDKEFYMTTNDLKIVYSIDESLNLYYKKPDGYFGLSHYNTLSILNGDFQLEEIKEPLLTNGGKEFLRQFKFDTLKILTRMYMYDKNGFIVNSIMLENINCSFDGLEKGKKYSKKELGL